MSRNENFYFRTIRIDYTRSIGRSQAPSVGELLYLNIRDEDDTPDESRGDVQCEIVQVRERTHSETSAGGRVWLKLRAEALTFRFRGEEPPEEPVL